MAPLAPTPSARPGTGLFTGPTDGAAGSLHQLPPPALAATSVAWVRCRYVYSCMHDHVEQVARHHARQAHFPSLYSPVCFLAPRGPSLVPFLLRLSLPCSPCSLSPVCPFFLLSLLVPPLSRSALGTLHDTVPDSFSFVRGRLVLGRACCPAARGTSPFPSRRLSICMSPHLGLSQCSSVLDRDTARKLHATLHYCLIPRSLSLSSFPCLPCAYPWAPLFSLSLSHARYTTMCRAPSVPRAPAPLAVARTVHVNPLSSPAPVSVAFRPLLCPCLVPSASLPSLARPVPSSPLVLCPTPTLFAHPPSEHDARHSPVLGYIWVSRCLPSFLSSLLASCFTELI